MKKKVIVIVLLLAAVLAAAGGYCYYSTHIFVDGTVYPKDAQLLDLRGNGISVNHYETVREKLPDCEILWDVPFQGGTCASDTTELTISSLTDADVQMLDYLPQLSSVDAAGCTDYPQLMELQKRHPECQITYQVTLGTESYPESTSDLTFTEADPAELLEKLQYLPELKTVHFVQPTMAAESLLQLRDTYPEVAFSWELDVFDVTYPHDVKEFDFSEITMESVDYVENAMQYFPELEKVFLGKCGIENEVLAEYRNRAREHYKVVWAMDIGPYLTVRTDDITFMPEKFDEDVYDWDVPDLVYCEDMLCVDIGHKVVSDIDWVYGMPHLQYLILADTRVTDITPVGTLKELIYFEVFKTDVADYSPLVNCTALEDVNVSYTEGDASVFAQMPWLKNLWVNGCDVDDETRALLTESLPDAYIEFDHGWHMGNNWRALWNYFKMRDLLEMPYFDWGNTLGRPGDPEYPYSEGNTVSIGPKTKK